MTIFEKLKNDVTFNTNHPLFAPYDDDEFGKRNPGRFEKIVDTDEGPRMRWIFDNGNSYYYDSQSQIIYEGYPFQKDFFIHKWIEKHIYDLIVTVTGMERPSIQCVSNEIIATSNPVIAIRAIVNRPERIVSVTNIHIYERMRHNGYGKLLLKNIYKTCRDLNYRLFLTETVQSFYDRMVARGARIIEVGNVLEIIDTTDL